MKHDYAQKDKRILINLDLIEILGWCFAAIVSAPILGLELFCAMTNTPFMYALRAVVGL